MKATNVIPLKRNVLVRLDEARETKSAHGLLLPDFVHQQIYQGTVVSHGPECVDVREGWSVIMEKLCNHKLGRLEIPLDHEDEVSPRVFVLIHESDILCAIE